MATLLKNQGSVKRYPTRVNGGSVSFNTNEFLFISDSPETLDSSDLADNGCWLNRVENLRGTGQICVWHENKVGS